MGFVLYLALFPVTKNSSLQGVSSIWATGGDDRFYKRKFYPLHGCDVLIREKGVRMTLNNSPIDVPLRTNQITGILSR